MKQYGKSAWALKKFENQATILRHFILIFLS